MGLCRPELNAKDLAREKEVSSARGPDSSRRYARSEGRTAQELIIIAVARREDVETFVRRQKKRPRRLGGAWIDISRGDYCCSGGYAYQAMSGSPQTSGQVAMT